MGNPLSSDPHNSWELAKAIGLGVRAMRAKNPRDRARLERRMDEIKEQAQRREDARRKR